MRKAIMPKRFGPAAKPRGGPIEFCRVSPYLCGGCERIVTIEPCPICAVLAAQKRKAGVGNV